MATADKLQYTLDAVDAIQRAIIDRGGDVPDHTELAEYPAGIGAIPTFRPWRPHPDWWDMEAFYDSYTPPSGYEKRGFILIIDSMKTQTLSGYFTGPTLFATTDGAEFGSGAAHTWDTSKDKPCSLGYKTRGAVFCSAAGSRSVYFSGANLSFNGNGIAWLRFDDAAVGPLGSYGGTPPLYSGLEAIECTDKTTWSGSTSSYWGAQCVCLEKLMYPKTFDGIGRGTTVNCPNLYDVTWPDSNTQLSPPDTNQAAFSGGTNIDFTGFPANKYQRLPALFFNGCTKFNRPDILEEVTSIGDNALNNTGLTKLFLPEVTTIGTTALGYNRYLEEVSFGPGLINNGSIHILINCFRVVLVKIAAGWVPNTNISFSTNARLTAENFVTHFLTPLGVNGAGTAITITVHSALFAQLSDTEKQIAVDKNYILASA